MITSVKYDTNVAYVYVLYTLVALVGMFNDLFDDLN